LGAWTPIPNFTGTLIGNLYIVSGMNISYSIPSPLASDVNLGLFAQLNGYVERLVIANSTIATTNSIQTGSGWIRAGLFAGSIGVNGNLTECGYTNTNTITVNRNLSDVGGVAGESFGFIGFLNTLMASYNMTIGSITINGQGNIGGLIGSMRDGVFGIELFTQHNNKLHAKYK